MANNINLKSSDSITLELSTDNKTLSIKINEAGLDKLIDNLLSDKNSLVYKKIANLFAAKTHTHTVADITDLKYGTAAPSTGTIYIKY